MTHRVHISPAHIKILIAYRSREHDNDDWRTICIYLECTSSAHVELLMNRESNREWAASETLH